jgi:hypothetical protein
VKRILFPIVATTLAAVLGLGIIEIVLRLVGRGPWPERIFANEPTMHQDDPVLGWTNLEGRNRFPGYVPGAPEIEMNFWSEGRRASAPAPVTAPSQLVLLGCSVTQGWGISDSETYAWRLQERFPDVEVRNYGTGGYGTWQSYLTLQRALPTCPDPRLVLYAFIEHHETRNIASVEWLEMLSRYARRGHIDTPYATIDGNGNLVGHPPEHYLLLPLCRQLATVAGLQSLYMAQKTSARADQGRAVTERTIVEIDRFCREKRVPFAVLLLMATPATHEHYARFLEAQGIETIDCVRAVTAEFQIPGNPHPNGLMNEIWTDCMSARVGELLGRAPH